MSTRCITDVAVIALALVCWTGCRKTESVPPNPAVTPNSFASTAATRHAVDLCRQNNSTSLEIPSTVSSDGLLAIGQLTQLQRLELYQTSFDVEQLGVLSNLVHLKSLRLEDVAMNDGQTAVFNSLSKIEVLNLPMSKLTDDGLEELLQYLPHLRLLRIGSPTITDQGVLALASARNLRFLHLINVPVTDAGLQHLHQKYDLESLYIDGGNETESGIQALLQANPQLHFHRNQMHIADDANADGH